MPAPSTSANDVVALLEGAPASTREWRIEARIADIAPSGPSGARWLVDAVSVDDPESRPLRGRMQLYVRTYVPPVATGERVRFHARPRRITPFGNPGELDWVGWNGRRGVFVSAFVWDGRDVELLGGAPSTPAERVGALRARVTSAAR